MFPKYIICRNPIYSRQVSVPINISYYQPSTSIENSSTFKNVYSNSKIKLSSYEVRNTKSSKQVLSRENLETKYNNLKMSAPVGQPVPEHMQYGSVSSAPTSQHSTFSFQSLQSKMWF